MKRSIPLQRNALVSFHYFRDYDLNRLPNLRLIGDSGAFSAKTQGVQITVDDLAEWAVKWSDRLAWVAALDVIGNPEATYRNWRRMVDVYNLRAVPTVHFGTPPQELDRYAAAGCDFVGLGGLVGVSRKPAMRWLVQVFRYAAIHHPGMRFHGWGCTSIHHSLLPFYSVDSSSWTSGFRYGTLKLVDPRTGKAIAAQMNGHDTLTGEPARLLRDYYGVNPRDVARSTPDNRQLIVKVASMSVSAREQYLRRKHGQITAPEWIQGEPAGPHEHAAEKDTTNLLVMNSPAGPNEFAATSSGGNAGAYHLDALITSPAPAGPIEHAAPTSTPGLGDMNAAAGQGDR